MKTQTRNYLFNYLTLVMVIAFIFFFLWFYLEKGGLSNIFSYVGIFLLVPSAILFTIARIQLGGSFQASAEANKLVKTGIYKKIRHPVYLFGTIFLLGIIFITQVFPLLIAWALVIVMQIKRMKQEEKVLTEKFGIEYSAYKEQSWF
ncbi:MAG: isoprenylcysteine carboxylmethyltransferase family protein [Bacteroidota bacterium]